MQNGISDKIFKNELNIFWNIRPHNVSVAKRYDCKFPLVSP